MSWLAIDLGSTYSKIGRIQDGIVTLTKQAETPLPTHPNDSQYEIDANIYYSHVESLLSSMLEPDTQGILISTQMHGYLLTDKHFLPLTPYISWQDKLGSMHLHIIREILGNQATYPSGVPLKGNLAICSLLARKYHGLRIPDHAFFCTLGGYIIGRLTNAHVCHMTNAAPTGMVDVRNGSWNFSLIKQAGLGRLQFPRILTTLNPVSEWNGIPVYPDLGDQQVCAFGAGLEPEKSLHISVGTAGLLGGLTRNWGDGNYENRPWIQPKLFLRTVSGLPGGRNIAALHRCFVQIAHHVTGHVVDDQTAWNLLATVAINVKPCDDIWTFLNLQPEEMIASLYASIALQYKKASDNMALAITNIAFSGGCVAKNPALRTTMQHAFSCACSHHNYDVMQGMRAIIAEIENTA